MPITPQQKEFLIKLADLMDAHQASMDFTNNEDGIHIELAGQEVFVGWLDDTGDLRAAAA